MRASRFLATGLACLAASLGACTAAGPAAEDGRDDAFLGDGKADGLSASPAEAAAILHLVNTATLAELDDAVGLSATAAKNLVAVRAGADAQPFTTDDDAVSTLAELDAVPYIGPAAFGKLLDYVHAHDLVGEEPAAWHLETLATGDDAAFALDFYGGPVVAYRDRGTYSLRQADGTTLPLPAEVTRAPQIAVDHYMRLHLFYPVGATHHHAVLAGTWSQKDVLDFDQLFVTRAPRGEVYALGAKRNPAVEGLSNLAIISTPNTTVIEPLWQARVTPGSHGIGVSGDGWPALAFDTGSHLRESSANTSGSGWTPMDIDAARRADAIATTAGDDATIAAHMLGEHTLRIYRQRGAAFYVADRLAAAVPTSLSIQRDGAGATHLCYVSEGAITYVDLGADGLPVVTDLGAGDQCAVAVDAAGTVHLFTRTGTAIRHGARQP